jgi:hypothetical protein
MRTKIIRWAAGLAVIAVALVPLAASHGSGCGSGGGSSHHHNSNSI